MRFLIALPVALILAGCLQKEEAPSTKIPPPVIDTSTPDRAIKSYWAFKDWEIAVSAANSEKFLASDIGKQRNDLYPQLVSQDIVKSTAPRFRKDTIERNIREVKTETESRAVIIVNLRNITPLQPEDSPDKWDLERREKGDLIRYVLEKVGSAWKVAEIAEYNDFNRDWRISEPTKRAAPSMTYGYR